MEIINRNVSSKSKYLGLKIELVFQKEILLDHKIDFLNF
ncbi:hypothetical protein LEP1GSC008_3508 [Leptospira kirschneri serovar Bulgarica str. Nikolaevo]|uniref:Uncharacterized protein n=1 Tax=Leptospira kirschneri serovar Bulgarica str. Nikolaevo TaxID=1240687 RepID=M6F9E1_9LEPT|nr:hypothetical protein LEP1GSC008_3508 [Leptospira kirschneri serovar Bulgarica str. Nikolaevo]